MVLQGRIKRCYVCDAPFQEEAQKKKGPQVCPDCLYVHCGIRAAKVGADGEAPSPKQGELLTGPDEPVFLSYLKFGDQGTEW